MNPKNVTGSIPLLLGLSAVFTGILAVAIFPGAEYVTQQSVSIVSSFYVTGGLMLLVILASGAQGLLLIRLIWGPAVASTRLHEPGDEDDDLVEVRAMKVTGTKKVVILLVMLALNAVVFDSIGKGIFLTDTRAVRVLTLLRSTDGQDRADAVNDAIILVGDKRVTAALKHVLNTEGEAREWAAYAAGVRHDKSLADSLVRLLQTGNERERSASATGLARLKDDRLISLARDAYPRMGKLKGDLIKALGLLGRRPEAMNDDLKIAGEFLTERMGDASLSKEVRRVVIWAIGRFNAPEALVSVEKLLEQGTDNGTLCTGLETIGRIGSASSSPKLVEAIYKLDRKVQCPEIVYKDFAGDETLICSRTSITERLLQEIARIGDRRARPAMEKLAKDKSFPSDIQSAAADIAFQMKYKPVEPLPEDQPPR